MLSEWGVFADGVGDYFLELAKLRNRSIHFNADTYAAPREDALSSLQLFSAIISKQFGYFGRQPWFIADTPGAQFVKKSFGTVPFVQTYILARMAMGA
ncbi:hypothetical protein NKH80_27165 [Mesorhizobium sp. M0904]|uniref:hypothetical protein n=1 Tax=unclassified Mesorhizobium TaxID=325217 RepID=UPI00333BEBD6